MTDIRRKIWGKLPDGTPVYKYIMTNASGASVTLSNIGAGIVSIMVPDKNGKLGDVVLGYNKPESYLYDGPCCGKVPGRFANRIAKGKFTLDGKEYTLPINNGENHLHGGPEGFHNKVWEARKHNGMVEFKHTSPDGEMGYPGNLTVVTRYSWSDDNELKMTFSAKSHEKTVINLVKQEYFNRNEGKGNSKRNYDRIRA